MAEVQVCQSDYLAADDLGGKDVTVTIASVALPPELPSGGKRGRKSKSVLITFAKAHKKFICNTTNQWSIALLLGSKSARDWVGKRITLRADTDIDIESGQPTLCIRIGGSPDADKQNAAAYAREWRAGNRQRGALCKRVKRAFRMLLVNGAPESSEPDVPDAPVFEDESADVAEEQTAPNTDAEQTQSEQEMVDAQVQ